MCAYTVKELNVLEYIVDNFNTSDYKFLSVLLKDEFNNTRTEKAYLSRLYKIYNGYISNKIINYSDLNIKNKFLKKFLEPVYISEPTKWEFDPGYPQELIIMDHNVINISIPSKKTKLQMQNTGGFNINKTRKRKFNQIDSDNLYLKLQRDQLLKKVKNHEMEIKILKNQINLLQYQKHNEDDIEIELNF